jgi:hypothetical protein
MRTLLRRPGRRALLASAAVAGLVAAGIAIADPGAPASTKSVSATFYTTAQQGPSHTTTCAPVGADAYSSFEGTFTGVASSGDARLAGPVTVHVHGVFDTTQNVGSLKGDIDIQNSVPGHFHGHFKAVQVGSGVQGWIDGNLGDGTHLMGSLTSSFSTTTGFGSQGAQASIGSGSGTNTAITWNGRCDGHSHHSNGSKPDKHHHH